MTAHWQYLRYVARHKWYVFRACRRLGAPLWRAITHDLSKFSPAEWSPYVDYFYDTWPPYATVSAYHKTYYGDKWTQEWAEERFDRAWLHHQHANPHHWQWWLLREDDGETKVLAMPEDYIREMVADWWGAGMALGKPDTRGWYEANQHKMALHPHTRSRVETLLDELERAEQKGRTYPRR